MKPSEVEADDRRNVFWMYFRGVMAGPAMEAYAVRSAKLISQMRPGFTVVTDLSDLESMDLDCVTHITHLMDLFLEAGVGQVVRVIPDPGRDIGFTMLSHTHYRGRVPIRTCESRAEAERAMLDCV